MVLIFNIYIDIMPSKGARNLNYDTKIILIYFYFAPPNQ